MVRTNATRSRAIEDRTGQNPAIVPNERGRYRETPRKKDLAHQAPKSACGALRRHFGRPRPFCGKLGWRATSGYVASLVTTVFSGFCYRLSSRSSVRHTADQYLQERSLGSMLFLHATPVSYAVISSFLMSRVWGPSLYDASRNLDPLSVEKTIIFALSSGKLGTF